MSEDVSSLTGLFGSILRGFFETLRRNKIAAFLSIVALVATTILAVSSQYDERPRYREVLLPNIAKAESLFFGRIRDAEQTDNENWRATYFVDAHRRARDVLAVLKNRWPHTPEGIRAHNKAVLYYELLIEDFAIIRTQMSLRGEMDYMAAWQKANEERRPLHDAWVTWLEQGK